MLNYTPTTEAEQTPNAKLAQTLNKTRSKRTPSEQSVKDFLLSIARRIDREGEHEERIRVQTMVAMCRRHRGATPSDLFGIFNEQGTRWLEHSSFADLHGTNIFQSLVRGAEANYLQAEVKLDITPTANNFHNQATAKIANGIYSTLSKVYWNETVEQQVFYAMMLKLNAFIISRFNPSKGDSKMKLPKFEGREFETSGTYICPECETSGDFNSETGEKCQTCGNEDNLTIIDDPQAQSEEVVSGYEEEDAGEIETIVADGFDCRFDDSNSQCADITGSLWFEYHYLCDKEELKGLYPHLKGLDAMPTWTMPTAWKQAYKRHQRTALTPSNEFDRRMHEVREIYLLPPMYQDYVSPDKTKIGEEFSINPKESLIDMFPDGLLFLVVNNEIACLHPSNFQDCVKTAVWLADPLSGWGLGAKAGLPIQKKINHLDNLNMEGIDRALRGALIYDPNAISGASLEGANTNIPLRSDFERNGMPLNDFAMPLNVSGMSQDVMLYLQVQHDVIQKVMGVPDAAIGETNPNNVTATGQQLEANKATGLLVPAKKSQAHAMEGWCADQLQLVQKHYPASRIKEEFGAKFGEDWLDEEIEAFVEANLKEDITIEYVAGSEVPQTRAEKEAKLGALIGSGLVPPTPANINKLVAQSGVDGIDVGDYESNIKIAKKRFSFVTDAYKANEQMFDQMFEQAEQMMIDPMTGQPYVDPMTGQAPPNPMLAQFMQAPQLEVFEEAEDHAIQEDFWKGKAREILASSKPSSPLLLGICRAMIIMHQTAQFAQTTKLQALQAAAMMPAQQAQVQQQSQQQQEQSQQQSQQQQEQSQGQQAQAQADAEAERQFQLESKAIDHEHELELAKAKGGKK